MSTIEAKENKIEKFNGHTLVLYWRPGCPYCDDVMDYMKENKIPAEYRNIENEKYRKELIKIGKKQQVPCLVIDGTIPMYGSNTIEYWLKTQVNQ